MSAVARRTKPRRPLSGSVDRIARTGDSCVRLYRRLDGGWTVDLISPAGELVQEHVFSSREFAVEVFVALTGPAVVNPF